MVEVRCCDGCGEVASSEEAAQQRGWTCLQITNRYRCPSCVRKLAGINGPWCCERGRDQQRQVCDECAELWTEIPK